MKKVLIITYYWPPAGGPGVQRWLKFVKYLPDFDIEPIVFIPKNPTYPTIDPSLNNEVDPNLTLVKLPIFEPYKYANLYAKKSTKAMSAGLIADPKNQSFIQKSLLYIRGNFFIPDARKFWIKPAVSYLNNYLQKENIDTVITTGPPHSMHLIGLGLKKLLPIKWIADFRDPWTNIGYQESLRLTKSSQKKHELAEKKVLNTADNITVTSFTTKKEFKGKTKIPVNVITNGYDDEKILNISLDESFTLSHIGVLFEKRNPLNLWKAISELTEESIDFKNNVKIKFIGKISKSVLESLSTYNLNDYVELVGYVSHEKALQYQRSAQVLLLLEINSWKTQGIIPGKIFEYMQARRPILAIGPEGWDVAQIITDTNTGHCFNFAEKEHIKAQLLTYFEAYKKGNLSVSSHKITPYHRKNLTAKLADIIHATSD